VGLFDVHAHLTSSRFDADRTAVIERAAQAGVTTIISNGLNVSDNEKVLALAAEQPLVRAAFGLYPVDAVLPEMLALGVDYPRDDVAQHSPEETLEWIRRHADRAVAIGEIGLDHYWVPEALWQRQEQIFRQFVALAMELDLPIIIHTRKAERRTFEILLGIAILIKPWRSLVIFVLVWKFATELLRPLVGQPWFQFVERVGDYVLPPALLVMAAAYALARNRSRGTSEPPARVVETAG
jgi:predicted metal-dependent TIM-barrel fold hydrolase